MLRVEIGPVEGSFPGMLKDRGYTLKLPADWPPASVTVNGVAVKQAGPTGKGGWSFDGNSLTTIIPVERLSTSSKVTIEVHRGAGLTARRAELDGFNGAMARLRETYNALNMTPPVAAPPDLLIDAMQTGDRLGYHPELAQKEIVHLHEVMPKALAAVNTAVGEGQKRLDGFAQHPPRQEAGPIDMKAEMQKRTDALARAQKLISDAGN
jgi:hypothetical protein